MKQASTRLTIRAIPREAIKVTEIVIGIDFKNSPMMPVENSSGRNAHTVVSVVVVKTILKSFNTSKTASSGVNLRARKSWRKFGPSTNSISKK